MHISHALRPSMASYGALDLTIAINSSSYGSSDSDLSAHASSPVQLDLLPHEPISHKLHIPRKIDVNQVPPVLEYDDSLQYSQESLGFKREREKFYDADQDRTCEISSRASDEDETGHARKKLRLTKEQSSLLEESFKDHSTLNPKQKNALAKQLNLRPRQVEVWFQNRRARTKLKQTEVDCELLKRCCETLTEENRRLQKELQELRAIKVAPPCVIAQDFYMPLPAATLTMCPSCERLATTVDNRALGFVRQQLPHFSQPSAAC